MHDDFISLDEYVRFNLEWLACDQNDNIGKFEACGYAPMPDSIWASRSGRIEVVGHIKQRSIISQSIQNRKFLSKVQSSGYTEKFWKNCDFWAFRGVFVYQPLDDPMRVLPYERVVSPLTPLKTADLPETIGSLVQKARLPVSFPEAEQIPFRVVGKIR